MNKTRDRKNMNEAVVKRFIADDMRAFDIIYSEFNPRLKKFISVLTKNASDADELVQEVFMKIWQNREKLKNYSSFESYLFRIAYRTTIDLLRKRSKEAAYIEQVKSLQVFEEYPDEAEESGHEETETKLNLLIDGMPARQREVFKMKYFQDSSYKEIADHFGISVNTVQNHMAKAHRFLKENLGRDYLPALLFLYLFL
ncbi:MAG: RNA polymerase sigma-70 factor [Prolixibacteraceae bacterium]